MKPEQIKNEFINSVNLVLELSKIYREQNYFEFIQDNKDLKYLDSDSLKNLNYIIKALNKELHPDMQLKSDNPLNFEQAKELQSKLNIASSVIKKYGHVYTNIDLAFSYNQELFKEKKSFFKDLIKEAFANKNDIEKPIDPYENIKNHNLKKLFIDWDLSHKSLNYIRNKEQYQSVYNEMIDDLYVYMYMDNDKKDLRFINENLELAANKLMKFIQEDVKHEYQNGNKINIQNMINSRFEYLFLGKILYEFNESFSVKCNIFARAFNKHIENDKYKININYTDFKDEVIKETIFGFASKDKELINNIVKNGNKISKYLDKFYTQKTNFIDMDNELFNALNDINNKDRLKLCDFLIKSNSLNFEQINSFSQHINKKSFIEKVILGDNAWKMLSNKIENYNFDDKTTMLEFQLITNMLYLHNNDKNTLSLDDLNTIVQYTKQIVISGNMNFKDENALVKQVGEALKLSNKYNLLQEFAYEIQDIRDENFYHKLATQCIKQPALLNQLSLFNDYTVASPNPKKLKDELEMLGVQGVEKLSCYINVQEDYKLKSMGLLHKNNKNHKAGDFKHFINCEIYDIEIKSLPMKEQVLFCLKTKNMGQILNIILNENIGKLDKQDDVVPNFFNTLKNVLIENQTQMMHSSNKIYLYDLLNRNEKTIEQCGIKMDNIDDLRYKDSLLYAYINEKTHNKLDEKLNLLDDFTSFMNLRKSLNADSNLLTMISNGINYFTHDKPIKTLFESYEQRDLDNFNRVLSKINPKSDLSYKDFPLISYIGFTQLLNNESCLIQNKNYSKNDLYYFNEDVISLLKEKGFNNALQQKTPLSLLTINDCYSAYQQSDLLDVIKEQEKLQVFNKTKTWKDRLLDKLNVQDNGLVFDEEINKDVIHNDISVEKPQDIVYVSMKQKRK